MGRLISKTLLLLMVIWPLAVSGAHAGQRKAIHAICDEWPPYQTVTDGLVDGFSTQVVRIVFQRMGVPFASIRVYPWQRAITMMAKGEADALFSANFTPERSGFAYYPEEPIIRSAWVMWVREGENLAFRSFEDLAGKRVGVVRGYSYTPAFWHFIAEHAVYEEVGTDTQNFMKLQDGRLDYVAAELQSGRHIVRRLGMETVRPLTDNPIKVDGLYIIFNRNNVRPSFVAAFSDALQKLKREPRYAELIEAYLRH